MPSNCNKKPFSNQEFILSGKVGAAMVRGVHGYLSFVKNNKLYEYEISSYL